MLQVLLKPIKIPRLTYRKLKTLVAVNKTVWTTANVFYKQDLPKLPVPALHDTLHKYLLSVLPILTDAELQETIDAVKEFGKDGGVGEELQKLLENRARARENWLSEWWLNAAYLSLRDSVVINISPGLVYPFQKYNSLRDRLVYASKLIVTTMKYKEFIDKDKIPLDKMGKDPLDMRQYKMIFGTCRIPKLKLDAQEFHSDSDFIVVVSKNNFFKLYVMDENKVLLNDKQIFELLDKIEQQSKVQAEPVGVLSADNRDKWATSFQLLIKDPENLKCVEAIQKSLFLVCLDGPPGPEKSQPNRITVAGHQCIHGGGKRFNSGSRWFDKTVQFVIGVDGIVGICYEHSPCEGMPVAVMTDFIVDHINDPTLPDAKTVRKYEHLKFKFSPEVLKAIEESSNNLDKAIGNFDFYCHSFEKFGKNFVKSQKMSPDSFFQMALQLAYYRLHKKPAPQYETAATRKYIHGRTDTIRSCSLESIKFAKAMLKPKLSPIEKKNHLIAAINGHKKYTVDAVNGFGIDRHLLGLQLTALENGFKLPKIFTDKAFAQSKHFLVATSQVATKCPGFMCYGASFPDGYGICYNPRKDNIFYTVACFNECKETNALKMKDSIEMSLMEMRSMLLEAQKAK